jgi:iron complex transport system ATP-binding protein
LLCDVSVAIHAGESWVVLGPNGAGKTTLLSLFGAIAHPTTGSVHVLGHRLGRVDMRELRTHLGHVNPRHTVSAPLTLLHVVLAGLTNTPEFVPRWSPTPDEVRRAEDLIETLGLRDRAHARWAVLSHGERGRGLIARALIGQPHLLILDEPATGLDLAAREQLLAAMDELRRTDRQTRERSGHPSHRGDPGEHHARVAVARRQDRRAGLRAPGDRLRQHHPLLRSPDHHHRQ